MRRRDSPLSPAAYWRLRFFSPLIMLVGMAAGVVLIVRSILVWGVDGDEYPFGPDIPISAAALLLWVGAVALLMLPPRGVIALRSGPFDSRRLVWSLGRRFRAWNMIAAPVAGLAVFFSLSAVLLAVVSVVVAPAGAWLLALGTVALAAIAIGLGVLQMRGALHGVQLTPTHLIAHGYLRTRRYPRWEIVSINAVEVKFWPSILLRALTNRDARHTIQLSLASGTEPVLLASNSHETDVEAGAEVIRAWRSAAEH